MQRRTRERPAAALESATDEQAHLRAASKRREGNVETATVREVDVAPARVTLTVDLPWTASTGDLRLRYDLDDARDLLQLEALCERLGFAFEQAGHLAGSALELRYAGDEWVPEAHAAHVEGAGDLGETFRSELRLLARSVARSPRWLRRGVERVRGFSTKQTVLAVVVVKKLVILALLAYLLL